MTNFLAETISTLLTQGKSPADVQFVISDDKVGTWLDSRSHPPQSHLGELLGLSPPHGE